MTGVCYCPDCGLAEWSGGIAESMNVEWREAETVDYDTMYLSLYLSITLVIHLSVTLSLSITSYFSVFIYLLLSIYLSLSIYLPVLLTVFSGCGAGAVQ